MNRTQLLSLQAAYWALFLTLVAFFFLLSPGAHKPSLAEALFHSQLTYTILLPALLGFYSFRQFVFPRSGRCPRAILAAGLSTIVATGLSFLMLRLLGPDYILQARGSVLPGLLFIACIVVINGVIAIVLQGFSAWRQEVITRHQLDRKNFELELELINARLQPHFLFNTLNNIDVMIGKDRERASQLLNGLSEILRFMLYETKADKIDLERELDLIGRYLELQRIRHHRHDFIRYEVVGEAAGRRVAPLLFLPFIENAFKHADMDRSIAIRFEIGETSTRFTCRNHRNEAAAKKEGIGTELISRRLDLLYGTRHTLIIDKTDTLYSVTLTLRHDA